MPKYLPFKKSLGQNFLVNPRIVARIVDTADIKEGDIALEIGPGTGNLTRALALRAKHVIAVEKDHRLIEKLRTEMPANVKIVEKDALKFKPKKYGLHAGKYKIIANIPYYITSHFIRTALEYWPRPKCIVLMVQHEVAKRIVVQPPDMNLLALSVQFYGEPKIEFTVSRGNFRPIPNVDSAIVRIVPHIPPLTPQQTEKFFAMLRSSFSSKRKQLINSLSLFMEITKTSLTTTLRQAGISPTARPEELSLTQWLNLFNILLNTYSFQPLS